MFIFSKARRADPILEMLQRQEQKQEITKLFPFYKPVFKKRTYHGMALSVRLSIRLSVRPFINNSCTLHNTETIRDIFMQFI